MQMATLMAFDLLGTKVPVSPFLHQLKLDGSQAPAFSLWNMYKEHKKIEAGDSGTTLVGTASPATFGDLFRQWHSVPDWAVASGCEGAGIGIWIANEFIDWEHYRETGEYRPVGANLTRSAS